MDGQLSYKMGLYAIQTKDLNFSFGKAKTLTDINLNVPVGSIFGFLGPNGAGKTTTIKCLLGLLHRQEGEIHFFGENFSDHRIDSLARIGSMIEAPSLYDHLNAIRNLEITAKLRGVRHSRIAEVIEIVGLTQDSKKLIKQYSTGMKQRLSLAIALLSEPELLLLDEPINGLDPGGIIEIRKLLIDLNQNHGCTVFLSSHILSEIEKLCSHVGVINKGNILFQGKMQSLLLSQTGKISVRIESADDTKAMKILEADFTVTQNEHLTVMASGRDDIPGIIRKLTEAGIAVYEVHTEATDLESSFLELINPSES